MNNRNGRIGWILLGVCLLVFLVHHSVPSRIASDLTLIGVGLAVVIALEFIVDGFNTLGWWFTFPPEQRGGIFPTLFFVRLAGTALNATLPAASMGGEPAKVYLLDGDFHVATVIATVMTSSFIFSLSKAGFITIGTLLTLLRFQLSQFFSVTLLVGFLATLAGVLAFLLLQLHGIAAAVDWVVARLPIPERWATSIRQTIPEIDAEISALYRSRPRDLALAVCSHQLAFLCGVLQVLFLLGRLGLQRSLSSSVAIESFAMLTGFVMFIVPDGLGVQEGGKLLIFTVLGLPAAAGVAVGIAFRLTSIVDAGAGLVALALLKGRKTTASIAPRRARRATYFRDRTVGLRASASRMTHPACAAAVTPDHTNAE
jgi:glycosyltransferase 2 family protein